MVCVYFVPHRLCDLRAQKASESHILKKKAFLRLGQWRS